MNPPSGDGAGLDVADASHRLAFARRVSRVVRSLFTLAATLDLLAVSVGALASSRASLAVVRLVAPVWLAAFCSLMGWLWSVDRALPVVGKTSASLSVGKLLLSFLLPPFNFFVPYQIVRALDEAIDPNDVPLPVSPREREAERGYRDPVLPKAPKSVGAIVRSWWATWLLAMVGVPLFGCFCSVWAVTNRDGRPSDASEAALLGGVLTTLLVALQLVACAALGAITVVLVAQMQARLSERLRRLAANSR
jgi:hypothetical protein